MMLEVISEMIRVSEIIPVGNARLGVLLADYYTWVQVLTVAVANVHWTI